MPYIPLLFGRFLVKTGWVSEEQVEQASAFQKELTPSLGLVAVLENMLTMDDFRRILMHQRRLGLFFQEAVTQLGLLDQARLAVLAERRRSYTLQIGAALVVRGDLTETELQKALSAFEHYYGRGRSGLLIGDRPGHRGACRFIEDAAILHKAFSQFFILAHQSDSFPLDHEHFVIDKSVQEGLAIVASRTLSLQHLRAEVRMLKTRLAARDADIERLQTEKDGLAEEYAVLSKEYERMYASCLK